MDIPTDGSVSVHAHIRIARPVRDLNRAAAMYRDGFGIVELGRFEDHDGFDGVMLGDPGGHWHFEFTFCRAHPVIPAPTPEDLVVLYVPDADEWRAACSRMANAGFAVVTSFNPYWDRRGRTFQDHDGYRVVLQCDRWGSRDTEEAPMAHTNDEKGRITLERTYKATAERVWDLWTTRAGVEATWGPDGFRVDVLALDLKPGGTLHYAMTAVGEPQVNFLKKVGFPLTSEARAIYVALDRPSSLSYDTIVDFVPGVEPYRIRNEVSLTMAGTTVTFRMTMDPLHDEEWTSRLVAGRNSQLDKLGEALRRIA